MKYPSRNSLHVNKILEAQSQTNYCHAGKYIYIGCESKMEVSITFSFMWQLVRESDISIPPVSTFLGLWYMELRM